MMKNLKELIEFKVYRIMLKFFNFINAFLNSWIVKYATLLYFIKEDRYINQILHYFTTTEPKPSL